MFGLKSKRRNVEERNKDPTFPVKSKVAHSKKTAPSQLGITINHAGQNCISRPPQTITYISPTSSVNGDRNHFDTRNDNTHRMKEPTTGYMSMDNEREAAKTYKNISNQSLARLEKLDPSHPMVAGRSRASHRTLALDLKHNDNSFQIVASLIVDRFGEQMSSDGTKRIRITAGDMYHLERVVPDKMSFIEAAKYRFKNCPQDSTKQIHVVTRQCHILGLDRDGEENLLYAPIGSYFELSETKKARQVTKLDKEAVENAKPLSSEDLARQQITTELQEARNLMAESVTPEATQFWTNQVVELQNKLRALDGKGAEPSLPSNKNDYGSYFNSQEGMLANLWQTVGYAPSTLSGEKQEKNIELVSSEVSSPVESPVAKLEETEKPIVDVVAPADLPGGYKFEAELNGKRFIATVPAGGVQKGKTFYCYMEETVLADIPMGKWRDQPTDLIKYGMKHPMFLNSMLCPLLALSQVMERVGLDITGEKASRDIAHRGFWSPRGMALSMLSVWAGLNITILFGFELKLHSYLALSVGDIISIILVNVAMLAFTIYATIKTRNAVMRRYQIPAGRLGSIVETILSAIFFPVVIAQMGRHTAFYDVHEGVCCHPTGIMGYEEP
mmetsp:Transcript_27253/g.74583  ORF Transcript_27253/g.74583 Transcript_27253/m.74583 type:complete len:615 (-) Transcript_27253:1571-3415(-)